MAADTKERIIAAAADLLAKNGFGGMGMKALSTAAGVPFGSIYHHFPGGKDEIAAIAVERTASGRAAALHAALEMPDGPQVMIKGIVALTLQVLRDTEWIYGCAVGSAAQDGSGVSDLVRKAAAHGFESMTEVIADGFTRAGMSRSDAEELASVTISTYEGAVILAKAQQAADPLEAAEKVLLRLIESALPPSTQG